MRKSLSILRARSARSAVAVILAAVGFLLSVQFAAAAVNQVQHELRVDHAAPAYEVSWFGAQDDHPHVHDSDDSDAEGDDSSPGPHHHHSDGPHVADLSTVLGTDIALTTTHVRFVPPPPASAVGMRTTFERPPRLVLEVQA